MTNKLVARDGRLRVVVRGVNPSPRACGGCTACCTALHVDELAKPAGAPCAHSRASRGCIAYAERPASCREFQCLWLRGLHATRQEHRPDRLGLMLVPTTDPNTIEAREIRADASRSVDAQFLFHDLRAAGLTVRIAQFVAPVIRTMQPTSLTIAGQPAASNAARTR